MHCAGVMERSGNSPAPAGVYPLMCRGLLGIFCFGAALAQTPPPDPIFAKRDEIYKARQQGRFADAASLRADARTLLRAMPADAPQYVSWVQSATQMYQEGGWTERARAVVLE